MGPPPGCTDSPSSNPDVIRNECGFFVSANGDDANAGTAEKPFKTLGKAVDAAKVAKARIYACADGVYAERVDLPGGVSVFGGFSCVDGAWKYDAATGAAIHPATPGPGEVQASLRVMGKGASQIEDVVVRASDAGFPGGSSIAVIVHATTVDFARTKIVAGSGAAGAQGATPTDDIGPEDPSDPAIIGNNGQSACMGGSMGNPGGQPKVNMLCTTAIGGRGGTGFDVVDGGQGDDGLPVVAGFGMGGVGEGAVQCQKGYEGSNGSEGDEGAGATADGILDATKGYVGASGMPGTAGTPGQGGGGGGGAKGSINCNGASGGSGGAGGCAGSGGLGGLSGGSSVGVVAINATLRFDAVDITAGNGGQGGDGGFGQTGGIGGNGGTGGYGAPNPGATSPACNGGRGGNGGNGGTGGGGRGGHSIGIASKGGNVSEMGATITTGGAGLGGAGGGAMAGVGAPTHAFP
ncbi:PGRS family protein [Polyangium spumosum]|uniref:PGRS family protein n=1 Tax=Polyangium spumosum TaxID=889282 RepID=A0A6N7Q2B2_9BACT|nr:PGRS family protein [Polyangium spumosum]